MSKSCRTRPFGCAKPRDAKLVASNPPTMRSRRLIRSPRDGVVALFDTVPSSHVTPDIKQTPAARAAEAFSRKPLYGTRGKETPQSRSGAFELHRLDGLKLTFLRLENCEPAHTGALSAKILEHCASGHKAPSPEAEPYCAASLRTHEGWRPLLGNRPPRVARLIDYATAVAFSCAAPQKIRIPPV